MERHYIVAGHRFTVDTTEEVINELDSYRPFIDYEGGDSVFTLQVTIADTPIVYKKKYHQDDEGQSIICGESPEGNTVVEYLLEDETAGWLVCNQDFCKAVIHYKERHRNFAVDNSLMLMYTFATSCRQTALFHSSVVSHKGKAYMFLGLSGTGKSTHSSLWLKYIEGTELVNDDNPVVRVHEDGSIIVYGSPWSGKTPCYRNVVYPVGGIVKLDQAPYNEINRLKGVRAYAAVVPSISGKRWDKKLAEGLHETENLLAQYVPVWHLDCLPDEAAARLCCNTCAHGA
jgi:hypothetical protein